MDRLLRLAWRRPGQPCLLLKDGFGAGIRPPGEHWPNEAAVLLEDTLACQVVKRISKGVMMKVVVSKESKVANVATQPMEIVPRLHRPSHWTRRILHVGAHRVQRGLAARLRDCHICDKSNTPTTPQARRNICKYGAASNDNRGCSTPDGLHNHRPQYLPLDFIDLHTLITSHSTIRVERRSCKTHRQIHCVVPTSLPRLQDHSTAMLHLRHVHPQRALRGSSHSSHGYHTSTHNRRRVRACAQFLQRRRQPGQRVCKSMETQVRQQTTHANANHGL